jgi:hypothetical protein
MQSQIDAIPNGDFDAGYNAACEDYIQELEELMECMQE